MLQRVYMYYRSIVSLRALGIPRCVCVCFHVCFTSYDLFASHVGSALMRLQSSKELKASPVPRNLTNNMQTTCPDRHIGRVLIDDLIRIW